MLPRTVLTMSGAVVLCMVACHSPRQDEPKVPSGDVCQIATAATDEYLMSVAFSPTGDQVAAGSLEGSLWLWSPKKGEPRRLLGPVGPVGSTPGDPSPGAILCLAFSPDGKRI